MPVERIYHAVIKEHFKNYDQMAFVAGARQVGKTTIAEQCRNLTDHYTYLNWDVMSDRERILAGDEATIFDCSLDHLVEHRPLIILDEIHKYNKWKLFLKGVIDRYKGKLHILVTGSAKLNIFQKGGDSLMGRYFLYRAHPLSVAENLRTNISQIILQPPEKLEDEVFDALFRFGGYPEPFLKQHMQFSNRWQKLRHQQLFQEDIRELSNIQELAQLEVLSSLIMQQTGNLVKFSNFAKKVRVSDQTIRRWFNVLQSFYYCFAIKPWSKNVSRSLLKEPKIYMWDWSLVEDYGARIENFVASHLLKAVHYWQDMGFGSFELYFIRDKEQREVDFLVTKDHEPWMLLEVKASGKEPISKSLVHFQKQLKPVHTLQLAFDLPYIDKDCFSLDKPTIVPVKTFLSQLI